MFLAGVSSQRVIVQHAGFALFGLLWLAVPVAVIVLVVWALTRQRPTPPPYSTYGPTPGPPQPSPLDILQRRFASGEISADEYQKARDLLKGS